MIILLLCAAVLAVLLISERLWRENVLRGEAARKFVHITVGAFVATWPLFVDMRTILIMSFLFLIVVYVSKKHTIFNGVHGVKRQTWGELMFPIGIGLAAILSPSEWIFSVAILHLSLADGFAAATGEKFGRSNRYTLFGETRSLVGTGVFFAVSLAVTAAVAFQYLDEANNPGMVLLLLPVLATVVENFAVKGTDNVLVPLFVVVFLSLLSS